MYVSVFNPFFLSIVSFVFIVSCFIEVSQQIRDITQDKKAGLKTTAVVLGARNSTNLMTVLLTLSVLITLYGVFSGILKFFDAIAVALPVAANLMVRSDGYSKKSTFLMKLFLAYFGVRYVFFP